MITSVHAYEYVVHSIIFKGIKKQINAVSVISRLVKLDQFSPNLNLFSHLFLPFCQPLIMQCTVVSVFCFSSVFLMSEHKKVLPETIQRVFAQGSCKCYLIKMSLSQPLYRSGKMKSCQRVCTVMINIFSVFKAEQMQEFLRKQCIKLYKLYLFGSLKCCMTADSFILQLPGYKSLQYSLKL